MTIHELTPAECREILQLTTVARLGCARDGQPYIVPVSLYFDAEADCLYGFSTVGQKIDWMRGNPKVCVEVERIVDKYHWSTVVVVGRFEEIGDSARDSHSRRRANELFEERPQWWLPGTAKLAAGEEHAIPVVYRIRIERLTGRRSARPDSE
jgi:nitroimidazol reductase NimA-like FMN-containing flavoprotein (pyridoxamine 5'-phosphate oxidase superfamily)